MTFTPVVETRSFGALPYQWPGMVTVERMGWHCYGGCRDAQLTIPANGERNDLLQELYSLIRCPITIYDRFGDRAWWGYVHEITVPIGRWRVSLSLADMANKVGVVYSYIEPGTNTVGQRRTTAMASDTGSQAEFGIRELLVSQGGLTDAVATQLRDGYLATHKYPLMGYSQSGGGQAQIVCRGWWDTLAWRLASVPSVAAISQSSQTTTGNMGDAAARTRIAQQFTPPTQGVNALQATVMLKKQGSPTDNVVVAIYALDASGYPTGSALASGTIAGSSLTTSLASYTITFSADVELQAGVMYGLQLSRSGAVDGSNYYIYGTAGDVYAGHNLYRYDGSAWQVIAADMTFSVLSNNDVETSEQVRNLLTNYGQFFSTVHVEDNSGVSTASYRDGETNARREVEALLDTGTTNNRRMLAEVMYDRQVRVFEEPAATPLYQFDMDGNLYHATGGLIDAWKPPVGNWVEFRNILGASVDTVRMINAQIGFLEGASWTERSGLIPEFRGQMTASDLTEVLID